MVRVVPAPNFQVGGCCNGVKAHLSRSARFGNLQSTAYPVAVNVDSCQTAGAHHRQLMLGGGSLDPHRFRRTLSAPRLSILTGGAGNQRAC